MSTTPVTAALVVCVAAAGVAAGAFFLEPGDDSPAPVAPAGSPASSGTDGASPTSGYHPSAGPDDVPSGAPVSLAISGFQFAAVEVTPGGQVVVDNRDGAAHTVTADGGDFDSGRVDGGSTAVLVAPAQPGSYDFHCEIHPEMSGTLTVR